MPSGQPYASMRTCRTAAASRGSEGSVSRDGSSPRRRGSPQAPGEQAGARGASAGGPERAQPVHAAQGRLEADDLAVRAAEVGEDLLLIVAGGEVLADFRLHVAGHGRGRV